MKTQLTGAPLAALCSKVAVASLAVAALATSPAVIAKDVAMDNLNRVFNPTLISAPASQGQAADSGRDISAENIARIFNPAMLTAGLSPHSASLLNSDRRQSDIAQENINRIFKATAAD
ncbi:MAG: hypothetical protein V7752_02480 [Halopseudomonas sp.]